MIPCLVKGDIALLLRAILGLLDNLCSHCLQVAVGDLDHFAFGAERPFKLGIPRELAVRLVWLGEIILSGRILSAEPLGRSQVEGPMLLIEVVGSNLGGNVIDLLLEVDEPILWWRAEVDLLRICRLR